MRVGEKPLCWRFYVSGVGRSALPRQWAQRGFCLLGPTLPVPHIVRDSKRRNPLAYALRPYPWPAPSPWCVSAMPATTEVGPHAPNPRTKCL